MTWVSVPGKLYLNLDNVFRITCESFDEFVMVWIKDSSDKDAIPVQLTHKEYEDFCLKLGADLDKAV